MAKKNPNKKLSRKALDRRRLGMRNGPSRHVMGKWCVKCPAVLFCMGEKFPNSVEWCPQCNTILGVWEPGTHVIHAIRKCRGRRPMKVPCKKCLPKMPREWQNKFYRGSRDNDRDVEADFEKARNRGWW